MKMNNLNEEKINEKKPKTLAVSMIVKNESAGIRACLESIKDADEIVIVDTGSEDNTVEICREYTDKVYFDKWRDDFSYSRNISKSHVTTDYFLVIDADEQLITPIDQVRKLINERWFEKFYGAYFTISMKYERFESMRLFKNIPEVYYIFPAHNVPSFEGNPDKLASNCYRTSFLIESGYSEAHAKDPDRTLRILLNDYKKDKSNTRTMYYLSREYVNRKEIIRAVDLWEKYVRIKLYKVERWDNELADVLLLLAQAYADRTLWKRDRWHDAVQYALWSHSVLPSIKETSDFLNLLFMEMPGSVDGAVRAQKMTADFWKESALRADDRGSLIQRIYVEQ